METPVSSMVVSHNLLPFITHPGLLSLRYLISFGLESLLVHMENCLFQGFNHVYSVLFTVLQYLYAWVTAPRTGSADLNGIWADIE